MRYLSLFSGIEAATVAWKKLGWQLVGVSEIDPYGCSALAYHHPNVPNLGDVTKITEADIAKLGRLDLIVFGSPCQDLSVAGKRKGLDGERSGLFFTAMRIVGWARKHCGLRWALWENVPGAFTSNGGGDFAVVVEQMAGLDGLEIPPKGWAHEGAAVGSQGMVEWSTLDAQWFGVAQRRKRVFALSDFGDWASRPPILLEPQELRGDSAPQRGGQEAATNTTATGIAERGCWWDGGQISQTLDAVLHKGQMMPEKSRFPVVLVKATSPHSATEAPRFEQTDVAACLNAWDERHDPPKHIVVESPMLVRKLTEIECERLQGFPDNHTLVPHRGKPAAASPRYKALGNSMCTNVMQWIGTSIDFAHYNF